MRTPNETTGSRIKKFRKKLNLRQADLAKILRCSVSQVSRFESSTGSMTEASIRRVARALEVSPHDLLPKGNPDRVEETSRTLDQDLADFEPGVDEYDYNEFEEAVRESPVQKLKILLQCSDKRVQKDIRELRGLIDELYYKTRALAKRKPRTGD